MILLSGAALTACGHVAPQVRIVEKAVPVRMPCVSDETPPPPVYKVTRKDLDAAKGGKRYTMAVAGFLERDQRLSEVEPVLEGCRR